MILTISGLPGAGKSTVARLLAKKLSLKHYSTGDFMREMAKERNLSLEELGKRAEIEPSIDQELDERQIQLGRTKDNFVIDARLGFHFIPHSIKIFLEAELGSRAQRILNDIRIKKLRKEESAGTIREMVESLKKREKSEIKRYQKYYQLNPYERKHYDLVVDTTNILPEEVAEKIVGFVKKKEQ